MTHRHLNHDKLWIFGVLVAIVLIAAAELYQDMGIITYEIKKFAHAGSK